MSVNPAAGKPADPSILVNVPKLVTAYYAIQPDANDASPNNSRFLKTRKAPRW
jgi:hypothetical protein